MIGAGLPGLMDLNGCVARHSLHASNACKAPRLVSRTRDCWAPSLVASPFDWSCNECILIYPPEESACRCDLGPCTLMNPSQATEDLYELLDARPEQLSLLSDLPDYKEEYVLQVGFVQYQGSAGRAVAPNVEEREAPERVMCIFFVSIPRPRLGSDVL
jgi:hypothetical protein